MKINSYDDIQAWQKAHTLVLEVYRLTRAFPQYEIYGLTSQVRRCSVSIPSNIVEGFRRKSKNDTLHFYNIAQSSLEELRYQLLLAKDLQYISGLEYEKIKLLCEEASKVLNGWIKSQKLF